MSKDKEKTIDLSKFQERLYPLSLEIDDLVNKHGYDNVKDAIADNYGRELLEDKSFGVLPAAMDISKTTQETQALSVRGAMYRVTNEHLLEYLRCVSDVEEFIKANEVMANSPNAIEWRQALMSAHDLASYANNELFDRVQIYKNEIEQLRGIAS